MVKSKTIKSISKIPNSKYNTREHRIITPLNSNFMLTSIIGFLISAFYIPYLDPVVFPNAIDYAFSFGLVFMLMFIASLISMSADIPYTEHLHIDEKRKIKI